MPLTSTRTPPPSLLVPDGSAYTVSVVAKPVPSTVATDEGLHTASADPFPALRIEVTTVPEFGPVSLLAAIVRVSEAFVCNCVDVLLPSPRTFTLNSLITSSDAYAPASA